MQYEGALEPGCFLPTESGCASSIIVPNLPDLPQHQPTTSTPTTELQSTSSTTQEELKDKFFDLPSVDWENFPRRTYESLVAFLESKGFVFRDSDVSIHDPASIKFIFGLLMWKNVAIPIKIDKS